MSFSPSSAIDCRHNAAVTVMGQNNPAQKPIHAPKRPQPNPSIRSSKWMICFGVSLTIPIAPPIQAPKMPGMNIKATCLACLLFCVHNKGPTREVFVGMGGGIVVCWCCEAFFLYNRKVQNGKKKRRLTTYKGFLSSIVGIQCQLFGYPASVLGDLDFKEVALLLALAGIEPGARVGRVPYLAYPAEHGGGIPLIFDCLQCHLLREPEQRVVLEEVLGVLLLDVHRLADDDDGVLPGAHVLLLVDRMPAKFAVRGATETSVQPFVPADEVVALEERRQFGFGGVLGRTLLVEEDRVEAGGEVDVLHARERHQQAVPVGGVEPLLYPPVL